MRSVTLKVTRLGPESDGQELQARGGPLFQGSGDIDYLCGNCGFVIVAGFSAQQHVTVDSTSCPTCGATNEFPRELRA